MAIILQNFEVRVSCQPKVRNVGTLWHFSANWDRSDRFDTFYEIADFFLARNPDLKIPQDDSHMFPRLRICPRLRFWALALRRAPEQALGEICERFQSRPTFTLSERATKTQDKSPGGAWLRTYPYLYV